MWFTYSQISLQCLIGSMTFVSPVVPEVDCRQDDETPAQIEVKHGTDVSPRRMIPNGPAGFFFYFTFSEALCKVARWKFPQLLTKTSFMVIECINAGCVMVSCRSLSTTNKVIIIVFDHFRFTFILLLNIHVFLICLPSITVTFYTLALLKMTQVRTIFYFSHSMSSPLVSSSGHFCCSEN